MKREYQEVACEQVGDVVVLHLDGTPVMTEAGHTLNHHSAALMDAVAEEWQAQEQAVDLYAMPLTRLLGALIELDEERRTSLEQELCHYALHDTLCYQGELDSSLEKAQRESWGRWLQWAQLRFGVAWQVTHGVMPQEQPKAIDATVAAWVKSLAPEALVTLYSLTQSLTSFILASALLEGMMTPDDAVACAWLESDVQAKLWGEDEATLADRVHCMRDVEAAHTWLNIINTI